MTYIRRVLLPLLSIVAMLCFMQLNANADTITFNPLELPGTGYTNLQTYTELGYTFANPANSNPNAFVSAQQGHPTTTRARRDLLTTWTRG